MNYQKAEEKIKKIINDKRPDTIQKIINFLYESFSHYSWVGIYIVKGDELVLGPWRGPNATEHTKIPIGKGVCGSAAESGKIEIVDDVKEDKRYLSCFVSTKSEIVVPIKKEGKIIGEIDIDSDKKAAFIKNDSIFLNKVADMLGEHI